VRRWYRHLGSEGGVMTKQLLPDLVDIEVTSGLALRGEEEFRGFLTVRALAEDGSIMSGQLDPDEVRKMALNFLRVAEGAVLDAMVMNLMVHKVGLEPAGAAAFIQDMRAERHRIDPDEDDR
jgi:hypothetical protein